MHDLRLPYIELFRINVMTKQHVNIIALLVIVFGFTFNLVPSAQAAITSSPLAKKESTQPIISSIKATNNGNIFPGDKVVTILKGKNLDQILSANIIQKMRSVGSVDVEKYTSTNGKQRRLILNISKKAKRGSFTLQLISKDKKIIKLPTRFKLTISSLNSTDRNRKIQ